MKSVINIALPKGRLGEKVYAMFERAGFDCPAIKENNRKLTFENEEKGLRFFWVKPSDNPSKTLRVATKFTNIARGYYAGKCRDIDIIHLNGSIELAPILGLSDVIVDIVETGKTLLENDLVPYETIVPISARVIANKANFKFKGERIEAIVEGLASVCAENKS